ncbi:hypothetical protein [Streptomyces brasiliscabiei]|nr:hypothetical protein [Streptomyces brasiliscabiei]
MSAPVSSTSARKPPGTDGGPQWLTGSVRSETRCGLFPARPYGGG